MLSYCDKNNACVNKLIIASQCLYKCTGQNVWRIFPIFLLSVPLAHLKKGLSFLS